MIIVFAKLSLGAGPCSECLSARLSPHSNSRKQVLLSFPVNSWECGGKENGSNKRINRARMVDKNAGFEGRSTGFLPFFLFSPLILCNPFVGNVDTN